MNKYFLTAIICLFIYTKGNAQGLKQIVYFDKDYPVSLDKTFYNSDSLIYGGSYYSGIPQSYVYKENKWQLMNHLSRGQLFTAPNSKVYFLDSKSFSVINPKTHTIEKTYPFVNNLSLQFKYFGVFNDSFFIVNDINSDTLYKFDFDDNKITKKTTLVKADDNYPEIELTEDSILYFMVETTVYKKNLKTNTLSKFLIYSPASQFKCEKNNLVILNGAGVLFISNNYGQSFKELNINKYGTIYYSSFHINSGEIHFVTTSGLLIKIDLNGKEIGSIYVKPVFDKLPTFYPSNPCWLNKSYINMDWLDDSTWLIVSRNGDIYKVYPFQKSRIKYLGGPCNLGVSKVHFFNNGNLLFNETENNLFSASIDTGKTWKVPEMSLFSNVKRVEFIDPDVIIFSDNKLSIYRYANNTIDTTFHSIELKIIDFDIIDSETLILFTKKGTYSLNYKSGKIALVGSVFAFENFVYLEKSRRILAFANVDVFFSDDHGKTWNKSGLKSNEIFSSLSLDNYSPVIEITQDVIYLKVVFNGSKASLKSVDGGKNFEITIDTTILNSNIKAELYDRQYFLDEYNRLYQSDFNSRPTVVDLLISDCPAVGMQSTDSGLYIWNSRLEIFYKKIVYTERILRSLLIIFPNPMNYGSVLNLSLPEDVDASIISIDIYDQLGKRQDQVNFEFDKNENIYQIKNMSTKASQFYFIHIKTSDGKSYRRKILVF